MQGQGQSLSGGHRRGATPVPIPNTEVKPSTGDGTNGAVRWESSKLPGSFIKKAHGLMFVRFFISSQRICQDDGSVLRFQAILSAVYHLFLWINGTILRTNKINRAQY